MEEVLVENKKNIIKKETIFNNDFSREIYEQTYKYGDENINNTFLRVAKYIASVEKDQEYWIEKFLEILHDFKFVPGGRITSNAGTGLKGTSMINCFVDGFIGEDKDSMEGILSALRRQALILKSEGGYGFCASVMRPKGSFISGIGNESPGSVKMLDMWDTQSAVITEGGGKNNINRKAKVKIRKGAQMCTMYCWHSDIEEFITAKQTPGRLTKFNMSVLITDEFMDAVKNHKLWNLEFPDYEYSDKIKEIYKKEWCGELKEWKEKGYPVKVYKTYKDANELWDIIMSSTYNRNEPGVIFIDTVNKLNNLYYCENIQASNPCGEEPLPIGGVCNLGSFNLTQFVNEKYDDWDYNKLKNVIEVAVRFMDNINDITYVPLKIQEDNLEKKRRIGLGILGYGSALMMMKIRYGSKVSLKLTEKLMNFITNIAYQSSAKIAKEKGSFPLFNKEKYLKSKFVKELSKETIDLIEKYGMRNSHLTMIAPTGNSSVFANNVSGGLEPIFMPEYIRTSMWPFSPNGMSIPKNVDWKNKQFNTNGTVWKWKKEGDEDILFTEFDNNIWKYDKSRGLTKETKVKDYALRFLEERGEWVQKAEWAATTTELNIDEHIKTMAIFAKYVDSAISKTLNIPNDYSYEDFKNVYLNAYKTGTIKGFTTYRAGTMTSVLSKVEENKQNNEIQKTQAPKRPKELECDIYNVTALGKKWLIIVGLLEKQPYEVFGLKLKKIHIPQSVKKGKLIKIKKGQYDLELDNGFILEDLTSHFDKDEHETLTRMISTSLRHGSDIKYVVQQLDKSEGTIVSFGKAISRTLRRYIEDKDVKEELTGEKCPQCNSENSLIRQESCIKCLQCQYSKCD